MATVDKLKDMTQMLDWYLIRQHAAESYDVIHGTVTAFFLQLPAMFLEIVWKSLKNIFASNWTISIHRQYPKCQNKKIHKRFIQFTSCLCSLCFLQRIQNPIDDYSCYMLQVIIECSFRYQTVSCFMLFAASILSDIHPFIPLQDNNVLECW